jgi:hypothetical protein
VRPASDPTTTSVAEEHGAPAADTAATPRGSTERAVERRRTDAPSAGNVATPARPDTSARGLADKRADRATPASPGVPVTPAGTTPHPAVLPVSAGKPPTPTASPAALASTSAARLQDTTTSQPVEPRRRAAKPVEIPAVAHVPGDLADHDGPPAHPLTGDVPPGLAATAAAPMPATTAPADATAAPAPTADRDLSVLVAWSTADPGVSDVGIADTGVADDASIPDTPAGAILPADGTPNGPAASGSPAAGGGTGTGGSGAGSGAAGASGTSDAALTAFGLDALASLVLGSVDDELPSSPVFGTDTTPD